SLISLVKARPRLASIAPFLCLILCHLEWPDINTPYLLFNFHCQCSKAVRMRQGTAGGLRIAKCELGTWVKPHSQFAIRNSLFLYFFFGSVAGFVRNRGSSGLALSDCVPVELPCLSPSFTSSPKISFTEDWNFL